MNPFSNTPVGSVAPSGPSGRQLLRWICTSNPFYVLSAGLFLAGLWISFGAQSEEVQTWSLMSGLAGYTLLLAATACLLVRFGNVWDDVRTVLLLVVLLFLATSVTFDEVLVLDPLRGSFCYLLGLLFAIGVTEGVLRGIRLRLPAWFRLPYHLILSLFFLYPLALRPLLDDPHGETLVWALFAFSSLAGLLFLTLLPAIRLGPDYVQANGSPWRWPLYPWVVFALLAAAVPARAFLLCWSMQLLQADDFHHVLFGPFFVAPFGLALAVLLLEMGMVAEKRLLQWTSLGLPILLLALTVFCHRDDPVYRQFLVLFTSRIGEPLSVLLLASVLFYSYAAWRRVRLATEALTFVLVILAVTGTDTLNSRELVAPQSIPLLAAALLQWVIGIEERKSWRCLLGTCLLLVGLLVLPQEELGLMPLDVLALHIALLAGLFLGALLEDPLARLLSRLASLLLVVGSLVVMLDFAPYSASAPPQVMVLYPLVMAALLAAYGRLLGQRFSQAAAASILVIWLSVTTWRGYCWLREVVRGLDHLLLGLALFAVAVVVSLAKSSFRPGWLSGRGRLTTNRTQS